MLLLLWTTIDLWTLYIFFWILTIYLIAVVFRYNSYIELTDEEIVQVKYNLLLKKIVKIIPYRDIFYMEFGKNHTLSQVDVSKCGHYIYWTVWEDIETIKIWKIFHLKKFKEILNEKKCLMISYWKVFPSYKWFVKIDNEKILISKIHNKKQEILDIKYKDIEQIEVVIIEEDNACIYIKIKNQQYKDAVYGLKNWNKFMNAIKQKWINTHFVSPNKIISNLKEEDLY